jgi:HD-GYP domain-containing protein (c-di-GMP phosphodiesterase class II)
VELRPVEQAEGMYLARSVVDPSSRLALLRAGVRLTRRYVEALEARGYWTVYVSANEPARSDLDVAAETRRRAKELLQAAEESLAAGRPLPLADIEETVARMVDELTSDPHALASLSMLRTADDASWEHSVNVAALAILAAPPDLDPVAKVRLGVGALLHDIGKALIPAAILTKAGPLNPAEEAVMREHTTRGFHALMEYETRISPLSAHVLLAHHERLDGSGYPQGLAGENLHLFPRVVAVADVWDAVTHARVYHPAKPAVEAAQVLRDGADRLFDGEIVRRLLSRIAVYPLGTAVLLADGQEAVVVEQNPERPAEPIVELRDGRRLQVGGPLQVVSLVA